MSHQRETSNNNHNSIRSTFSSNIQAKPSPLKPMKSFAILSVPFAMALIAVVHAAPAPAPAHASVSNDLSNHDASPVLNKRDDEDDEEEANSIL
ncbi:hypothetical protein BGZ95_010673, partial [Linnemannia exigua]